MNPLNSKVPNPLFTLTERIRFLIVDFQVLPTLPPRPLASRADGKLAIFLFSWLFFFSFSLQMQARPRYFLRQLDVRWNKNAPENQI